MVQIPILVLQGFLSVWFIEIHMKHTHKVEKNTHTHKQKSMLCVLMLLFFLMLAVIFVSDFLDRCA